MLKRTGWFAKPDFLLKLFLSVLFCMSLVFALENGLARTPQMGWNPWNVFYGNIDEAKMLSVAQAMKTSGMLDAGYNYFNLDDCWMATTRNAQGKLQAHQTRFPHGMKWLGDTLRAMGFKFGIYGDRGTMTCQNVPYSGSLNNEQLDAKTFAEWGVDYLKLDNCNVGSDYWGPELPGKYELMRDCLKNSGRNILFSICCWKFCGDWMIDAGNSWRTTSDIAATWNLLA